MIMNNKRWNSALLLTAMAAMMGMAGCKKNFLDREPLGRYTTDDLPAGSFESRIFGVYGALRAEGMSGVKYVAVHGIRSDDSEKGSSVSDAVDAENFFDRLQYTKDFWLLNDYWGDHYKTIGLANTVIADIDSIKATDAPTLTIRAEAKFIRAYTYFDLVRAFGEVPKIDFKVTNQAQANIAKSTVNEIYALIDADLQEAAAQLPLTWENRYIGRLTRGAAKALQAKTFLYRQNWNAALAAAKEVIASGRYSLLGSYEGIFREEGENSSESIFEIQAYYSPTQDLGIQQAVAQGVRGAGAMDLGWGWNTPTRRLYNAYEAGDPRRDATLLYSGRVNPPYNELIPDSTATIPRPFWNKKVYTNPTVRATLNQRQGRWMNMRVIRYADVLLMAAEAANELGGVQNTTDALAYLEMVRARARGGNSTLLPRVVTTDQAQLRAAIRHERRIELAMEYDRFFDLVRWGVAEAVFQEMGITFEPRDRYLPIPQPEVDKSGGVLKQNPAY